MCVNPPAIVTIVWWWPSQLSHTVSYCNHYIPLDPTGCDSGSHNYLILYLIVTIIYPIDPMGCVALTLFSMQKYVLAMVYLCFIKKYVFAMLHLFFMQRYVLAIVYLYSIQKYELALVYLCSIQKYAVAMVYLCSI